MSDKQKEALKLSIAHWERMRDDKRIVLHTPRLERPYDTDCDCCKIATYGPDEYDEYDERYIDCVSCPIYEYTEKPDCANTPYGEAMFLFVNQKEEQTEAFKDAAQKEINFLKEVLSWVEKGKSNER